MRKTFLSITVVILLLFSITTLCSCGKTICEACDGTGQVICSECEGLGEVESEELCFNCGGTGMVSYGYYDGMCTICGGDGYEDETELCAYCGGTGMTMCMECSGQGEY